MLTHGNLVSNAEALRETWRYTSDDVLIHALPIFHTHGLFVATNVTLFSGASMLFLPRFDADKVFELMPRATVLMGVPTFYVRLLQDDRLTAEATRTCGSSSPARRRCSPRPTASGRRAPATPSSSATA